MNPTTKPKTRRSVSASACISSSNSRAFQSSPAGKSSFNRRTSADSINAKSITTTGSMILPSKVSLQNNIGAMMLQRGSVGEAMERFQAAIQDNSYDESSGGQSVEGLVWFHKKLLREATSSSSSSSSLPAFNADGSDTNLLSSSFRNLNSSFGKNCNVCASSTLPLKSSEYKSPENVNSQNSDGKEAPSPTTTPGPLPSTVPTETIVARRVRRGSIDVGLSHNVTAASCSSAKIDIPLGVEYIAEPLLVGNSCHEENARVVASLNLSSLILQYGDVGNFNNDGAGSTSIIEQRVLDLLHSALEKSNTSTSSSSNFTTSYAQAASSFTSTSKYTHTSIPNECPYKSSLKIITRNNLGVIYFCQQKTKQALQEFEIALKILNSCCPTNHITGRMQYGAAAAAPLLPYEYLHLTTLCNMARTYVRLLDTTKASSLCQQISTITPPRPPLIKSNNTTNNIYTSSLTSTMTLQSTTFKINQRIKWIKSICKYYINGLIQKQQEHLCAALESFNHSLYFTRKELGHDHPHVAAILQFKGSVLFDQRKLQCAMLAFLACLKIYESHNTVVPQDQTIHSPLSLPPHQIEMAKILYSVGRTLHDREEYTDALTIYQKALNIQKSIVSYYEQSRSTITTNNANENQQSHANQYKIQIITTLCNISRIHRIQGDLPKAIEANKDIVCTATTMVNNNHRHPFLRNRLIVLGNLYVEAGRLEDAMRLFSDVARGAVTADSNGAIDGNNRNAGGNDLAVEMMSMIRYSRPDESDIDTSAFAIRAAERLGKMGLQYPGASAA